MSDWRSVYKCYRQCGCMPEICLNCETQVPKYMTQVVDLDTFPTLTDKAKKFGYTEVRVCEDCYDELSSKLESTGDTSAYIHPLFRNGVNEASKSQE